MAQGYKGFPRAVHMRVCFFVVGLRGLIFVRFATSEVYTDDLSERFRIEQLHRFL